MRMQVLKVKAPVKAAMSEGGLSCETTPHIHVSHVLGKLPVEAASGMFDVNYLRRFEYAMMLKTYPPLT